MAATPGRRPVSAWAASSGDRDRFPLEALAVSLGIQLGRQERGIRVLAEQIGVSRGHVHRLRREGLSERQADRFAIRAGTHPAIVWPAWEQERAG